MDGSDRQREGDGEARVRIGKVVLIRDEDDVWRSYEFTDQRCYEALSRRRGEGTVLTPRSPLGRAIFNARVGEWREYRSGDRPRSVWIESIKPGPVYPVRAEGQSRSMSSILEPGRQAGSHERKARYELKAAALIVYGAAFDWLTRKSSISALGRGVMRALDKWSICLLDWPATAERGGTPDV